MFAGEFLGVTSRPHTNDGTFFGGLVSLLYSAGPFVGSLLGVLLFGGITCLFFAQVYELWNMKRWSLYIAAASTILFFIFTLFLIANPNVSPYIGITSLLSGSFLGFLYHFRDHFK